MQFSMNTSNDVWCDLQKCRGRCREAYYRFRCHQLTRLKDTTRAKSWLHHLEKIFLNGNEVIVDRGNNVMMRSYEDVKFKSSGVDIERISGK